MATRKPLRKVMMPRVVNVEDEKWAERIGEKIEVAFDENAELQPRPGTVCVWIGKRCPPPAVRLLVAIRCARPGWKMEFGTYYMNGKHLGEHYFKFCRTEPIFSHC